MNDRDVMWQDKADQLRALITKGKVQRNSPSYEDAVMLLRQLQEVDGRSRDEATYWLAMRDESPKIFESVFATMRRGWNE